jgi:hypothetical protein
MRLYLKQSKIYKKKEGYRGKKMRGGGVEVGGKEERDRDRDYATYHTDHC